MQPEDRFAGWVAERRSVWDDDPKTSMAREVLRHLRDFIIRNGIQPGDRLPTERELASRLGVSRTSVRSALGLLEGIGAITRTPKRGILQELDLGAVADLAQFLMVRSQEDRLQLCEARLAYLENMSHGVTATPDHDPEVGTRAALAAAEKAAREGLSQAAILLAYVGEWYKHVPNQFYRQYGAILFEVEQPKSAPPAGQDAVARLLEQLDAVGRAIAGRDGKQASGLLRSLLIEHLSS